jgi:two-component system cell cycle sensor histidine kinase/response regulator CckA
MTRTTHNQLASPPANILIVDDEQAILNFMRAVMHTSGRNTREASDGAAALTALWENYREIKLLVTDVHMPRLDGLSLVRRARDIVPNIKVVVTSGGVDAAERQVIEDLDVAAFLQKPFSAAAMTSCIDAILGISSQLAGKPIAEGFKQFARRVPIQAAAEDSR